MQVEDCSQSSRLSRHTCHPLLHQHHVQLPSCFFACYASWAVWRTQTDRQIDRQIDRKKSSDKAYKAKSQLVHRHKNQREIIHHSQEPAPNVSYSQGSSQIASSLLPAHVQALPEKMLTRCTPQYIQSKADRHACTEREEEEDDKGSMQCQNHTHTLPRNKEPPPLHCCPHYQHASRRSKRRRSSGTRQVP